MKQTFQGRWLIIKTVDSFISALIPVLILWFGIGIFGFMIMLIYDMKLYGKRYIKENFLNYTQIIYLGWGGLAIVITIIILEVNKWYRAFTKFMYWLANIGVKKDGDDKWSVIQKKDL